MAISRSLMNRQLRADGGIMQVAPREKFGLGSKLKKFVRKIIPNEVSEIAVKAAPFVAPFNPLLAAGMAGIGGFDQTGRIGSSLKSGALTYGMGQLARGIGGGTQNLQKGFNPFGGYDASAGLTRGLLTNPISDQGGLGKFFSNQGTTPKEGVKAINEGKSTFAQDLTQDLLPGDTVSTVDLISDSGSTFSNFVDYGTDLLKKGAKAAFYDKDGNLDKAAVIGVATAAASYAEALMLARNAGVELTEEEYDQAQRDDKQAEYGEYLQNFFGGKKDGGRIGFRSGTIILAEDELAEMGGEQGLKLKLLAEKFMEDGMSESDAYEKAADSLYAKGGRVSRKFGSPKEGESEIGIMSIDVEAGDDEDEEDMMMAGITFSRPEKSYLFRRLGGSGGPDRSFTMPQLYRILNNPNRYPDDAAVLKQIAIVGLGEGQKDGGRIGYAFGTPKDETMFEELQSDLIYRPDDKPAMEEMIMPADDKMAGGNRVSELLILRDSLLANGEDVSDIEAEIFQLTGKVFQSVGGISNIPTGNMRKNNAGVVERDYRDEGGFVPVGIKERADDVPAMLSKNEFVMTADAVRGIGNGSVEEGSKKLYNTMKKAEQVGKA